MEQETSSLVFLKLLYFFSQMLNIHSHTKNIPKKYHLPFSGSFLSLLFWGLTKVALFHLCDFFLLVLSVLQWCVISAQRWKHGSWPKRLHPTHLVASRHAQVLRDGFTEFTPAVKKFQGIHPSFLGRKSYKNHHLGLGPPNLFKKKHEKTCWVTIPAYRNTTWKKHGENVGRPQLLARVWSRTVYVCMCTGIN